MSLIRRLRREESGTSLVVLVFSLLALLGFAAIAIDGAAAWALKRQDQNAADTGVIAGAIETAGKDKTAAMNDATAEVIRITYQTLEPNMTQAEWAAEWAACVDPGKPAEFTQTSGSDCVSFTDNLRKVRVTTPVVPWDTTFGKVIGFDQIDTRATAEVRLDVDVPGGVLPFGMPSVAAGEPEVCLKTGANPQGVAPCDGPDEGNFGFLDFTQFGNPDMGTSKVCSGGGTDRLKENIAIGIDHALGTWPIDPALGPVDPNHERDACDAQLFSAMPYQVDTQTGNVAQALDDGLADDSGIDGKLANGSNRIDVRGRLLDNTPLWGFLNANGIDNVCGAVMDHDALATCLGDPSHFISVGGEPQWNQGVIFDSSLADAPRLGWVPLLWEDWGPGSSTVTIKDIIPIYVQTTFWGCNSATCDLEWDPGEGAPAPGPPNIRIEAATAFSIPKGALPSSVRDSQPGTIAGIAYLLSK